MVENRFFAVFSGIDSGGLQFLAPDGATTNLRLAKSAITGRKREKKEPGERRPTEARHPALNVASLLLLCCWFCCTLNA
jgi:hypothetical protein